MNIFRVVGIFAFAILGATSLIETADGSDRNDCFRERYDYPQGCMTCLPGHCIQSGPGAYSTHPCGSCASGDWMTCCTMGCHCGD